MKYVNKPKPVDAFPWCFDNEPQWFRDALINDTLFMGRTKLYMHTLEGTFSAEPGDWIVRDENGTIEFFTPKYFEQTFQKAAAEKEQQEAIDLFSQFLVKD